jgi:DNA-binding transcriptional LysR family regulator
MGSTLKRNERILQRLKLRDLRVLLAVAETGSMGKSAAELAMSQPAISKAISEIEHVVGVRVLDRSAHGVEPTASGRALLKWTVSVFDDLRQAVKDIESLSHPGSGEIRLGTTDSMIAGFVPATIDRFSRKYPKVVFEVLPAATFADQYVDLRDRKIDLILGRVAPPATGAAELNSEILFLDPMFPAAAIGSKWFRGRPSPPDASFVRPLIDEAFRAKGLDAPLHTVGSNSVQLSTALLATGRFVGVLSDSTLRLSGKRLGIKRLPVDLLVGPLKTGIVTLKNRALSPTVQSFIACAREVARPFGKFES